VSPLLAFLAAFVVTLVILGWRRDCARQKAIRTRLVTLSQASRARSLAECPPEFLRRLEAVMGVGATEVE